MLALKPLVAFVLVFATASMAAKDVDQLQIGVKYLPEDCPIKTRKGDKLSMQWAII